MHALAWSLATGAAVTLSWWGVHTVMAGTAYDPPRAVPIAAAGDADGRPPSPPPPSPQPLIAATHRAESASPTPPPPSPRHSAGRARDHHPSPSSSPTAPASAPPASGAVKSYQIGGGRAVFAVGGDKAELVSATPDEGWQMQVWTQPEWIRVTFTRDDRESSVFYTWNGHAPMVQFDDR